MDQEPKKPAGMPPVQPPQLSLDDTIDYCIGPFGWRQFLRSAIPLLSWFFDSQQIFITIFTDRMPDWNCRNSPSAGDTGSTRSSLSCNVDSNLCSLPEGSWSWNFPEHVSVVSEWSLQCAGSIVTGLPTSSFLLGSLVGGLVLATLADSFLGRKNFLCLCCLSMSLAGLLTTVSTNIWIYAGLKFIGGFSRSMAGTCGLVLASELVARDWREKIGVIGFLCFGLGFLSLPIIAYFLKGCSWRLMYISTCVPCAIYSVVAYATVYESPRWLYIKGKQDEFTRALRSMAAMGSDLTQSFFDDRVEWSDIKWEENIYTAFKVLLRRNWSIRRLAVVMVVGFGIGVTYFGMPLGLGNLSFNLYLSVVLNAVSEMVASLATFFLVGRLNRKTTLLGLTVVGGIFNVASVIVARWSKDAPIALEIVSFFCACTSFDVVVVYTLELFPTSVRSSAVSMMREANLLGGAIGPVLAAVGRNHMWSYGVFGMTFFICGLSIVMVPETKGKLLCDTMEEEEFKYNQTRP